MDNRVLVLHASLLLFGGFLATLPRPFKDHACALKFIGETVVHLRCTRYTGSMLTFAAVVSIVILIEAVAALALIVYWLTRLERSADRLNRNTRWQLLGEGERDGSD